MPIQYIALLCVEKAHRGKGIGTALINKCATSCMATVLDNRIWEKLEWKIHTVVAGCITVAVHGLTTEEHRVMFDGEIISMWLHSKLPTRTQARMTTDREFAGALKQRLLKGTHVLMDVR